MTENEFPLFIFESIETDGSSILARRVCCVFSSYWHFLVCVVSHALILFTSAFLTVPVLAISASYSDPGSLVDFSAFSIFDLKLSFTQSLSP